MESTEIFLNRQLGNQHRREEIQYKQWKECDILKIAKDALPRQCKRSLSDEIVRKILMELHDTIEARERVEK